MSGCGRQRLKTIRRKFCVPSSPNVRLDAMICESEFANCVPADAGTRPDSSSKIPREFTKATNFLSHLNLDCARLGLLSQSKNGNELSHRDDVNCSTSKKKKSGISCQPASTVSPTRDKCVTTIGDTASKLRISCTLRNPLHGLNTTTSTSSRRPKSNESARTMKTV